MMERPARFAIAALVFVLDRLSKYWIEQNVSAWDTHVVIPGIFNIIHAENRGAAFGFLNQSESWVRTLALVGVSGLIMAYLVVQLWRMPKNMWPDGNLSGLALGLVLGGALGNLYDRVVRGAVTDFLQFFIGSYEWPSFNVADSAISVGAGLLFIALWRAKPAGASGKHHAA